MFPLPPDGLLRHITPLIRGTRRPPYLGSAHLGLGGRRHFKYQARNSPMPTKNIIRANAAKIPKEIANKPGEHCGFKSLLRQKTQSTSSQPFLLLHSILYSNLPSFIEYPISHAKPIAKRSAGSGNSKGPLYGRRSHTPSQQVDRLRAPGAGFTPTPRSVHLSTSCCAAQNVKRRRKHQMVTDKSDAQLIRYLLVRFCVFPPASFEGLLANDSANRRFAGGSGENLRGARIVL